MWLSVVFLGAGLIYGILPFILRSSIKYKIAGIIICLGIFTFHLVDYNRDLMRFKVLIMIFGFLLIRLVALESNNS